MLIKIRFIYIGLIFIGCGNKLVTSNEEMRYTADSFKEKKELVYTDFKEGSDHLIFPERFFKFKHYLIITDVKTEKALHIIDTKKDKYLGQYINRGKGPGEISIARSISPYDENSIMIFAPVTQRVFGFNIDSLIANGKPLFEKKLKLSGLPHTFVKINDSIYFTKQTDPSNRLFKMGFGLAGSSEEIGLGTLPWIAKNGHSDITNSNLCRANMQFINDKFVFSYILTPLVEIYDISKKSWKSIISPTEFLPEYAIPNPPNFAFTRNTLISYPDIALTDDYIYVLYSGKTYLNENKKHRNEANKIYVFDFEGNPIKELTLNTNLTNFTIFGNTIYGLNRDGITPKIVKFELE